MKDRAIFSSDLYVEESIKPRKLEKIKQKINAKPLRCNATIVTLAEHSRDQLNIFEARQLFFPYYEEHPVKVVAVFQDYDSAVNWIAAITIACYNERGDYNLKEYLTCRFS